MSTLVFPYGPIPGAPARRSRYCIIAAAVLCGLFSVCAQTADEDSVDRDYSAELERIPPIEPADALGSFEVKPGFRMELVAAEPLVRDPIAIAFDEDGRAYVVEMCGYSEQRDENLSAIALLEDTDGDGTLDKRSEFLTGLEWPTAVACYQGGVFVGVPPDLLYCKDTTGDGQADVREVAYTGFGTSNVQGMMNTLTWGLDNRIHGAGSSNGGEVSQPNDPNAPHVSIRGRDFSFDPRTRLFRAESGGVQHGLTFDVWGRKFLSHNSYHCEFVLFDDRYIARNPYLAAPSSHRNIAADGPAADVFRISPVEPWRIVRTRLRVKGLVPGPIEGGGTAAGYFTSATGITVYKGDAWPDEYYGNLIIGDVGSNLIHRKTVRPDGVALIAERADPDTEFVRSKDIWFRPVQYCNGPDGTLYVCDMYREVIEHPLSLPPIIKKHLDLTSGRDRGRIYRIVPEGFTQQPPLKLGRAATEELVPLLEHKNAWHHETAMRLLYERQDPAAAPGLRKLAAKAPSPEARVRALYALSGLGALSAESVSAALRDPHPRVREHAARLAEPFLANSPALHEQLAQLAEDEDVRVRYQTAFSLGEARGKTTNDALATIAIRDAGDPLIRLAILSSSAPDSSGLFETVFQNVEFRQREDGQSFLGELARMVGALGDEQALAVAFARLDGLPDAEADFANGLVQQLLNGLALSGRNALAGSVLANSPKSEAMLRGAIEKARGAVGNAELPVAARIRAIETLAFDSYDNLKAVLTPLFDPRQPAEIQLAALATLRKFDHVEVPQILLAAWPDLSPQMRSQAIEALFSRKSWTLALLDSIERGEFRPSQLDSTRIRALQAHMDPEVQSRAKTLLASFEYGSRQQIVDAYQGALTIQGNPATGKEIFRENCAQCHKLEGIGFDVGPELTTVAQAGAEKILVNVLDPNREVNPQYINYMIDTSDFESHSGIIASETATSITLKRANGESDTILRVNIDSIRSDNLSIMPEGWEETIDQQKMADLIAYIMSVK